jgi:hypothetical protein
MSRRGGGIGPLRSVGGVSATGIWSLTDQQQNIDTWPIRGVMIDYLVVAGGGGGGYNNGGGGGGGGMLFSTIPIGAPFGTYRVVVGAGGPGSFGTTRASNGSNSYFLGLNTSGSNSSDYAGFFSGSAGMASTKHYLSLPANNAFAFGTGNFTIEAWMYVAGNGSASSSPIWRTIASTRTSNTTATTTQFSCGVSPEGGVYFYSNGMSVYVNTDLGFLNKWVHIAFVKNGNSLVIYVNGISVGPGIASGTNTDNFTVNTMAIGGNLDGTESWEGFLSNVRIVKGVAVYTSNFTVPTFPLVSTQNAGTNISAIAPGQCSLLTLKDSTLIDASDNNFTITQNGTIQIVTYQPKYLLINSIGGGAGGSGSFSKPGSDGGSGGGAGNGGTPGLGRSGQGNNGGSAVLSTTSPFLAAGGGGAGAAAASSTGPGNGTNGGDGLQNNITGTAIFYAGGGRGEGGTSDGLGGGGAANIGGGGRGSPFNQNGIAGGSGVVILRTLATATATTGSPTITQDGNFNIYTFTASGSITF